MMVFRDIAQGAVHRIAIIFRIFNGCIIDDFYKSWCPCLDGAVNMIGKTGGDEEKGDDDINALSCSHSL